MSKDLIERGEEEPPPMKAGEAVDGEPSAAAATAAAAAAFCLFSFLFLLIFRTLSWDSKSLVSASFRTPFFRYRIRSFIRERISFSCS